VTGAGSTRWGGARGSRTGEEYAAQFRRLADSGTGVHGEADFVASLIAPPSSVLDAGCGTGRVMIELTRRGFDCVGADVDASMLGVARTAAPDLTWVETDLAFLALDRRFDLVVAAGNVIPLLAPGTEAEVVRRLAAHLVEEGLLVAGFGLDATHLPLAEAPFGIDAYDGWCSEAGLTLVSRFATWDSESFAESDHGYAVSIHRPHAGD
jgi:SAM-dependent methyltransferase